MCLTGGLIGGFQQVKTTCYGHAIGSIFWTLVALGLVLWDFYWDSVEKRHDSKVDQKPNTEKVVMVVFLFKITSPGIEAGVQIAGFAFLALNKTQLVGQRTAANGHGPVGRDGVPEFFWESPPYQYLVTLESHVWMAWTILKHPRCDLVIWTAEKIVWPSHTTLNELCSTCRILLILAIVNIHQKFLVQPKRSDRPVWDW